MTGRGIDQALPHSNSPQLHERFVRDARQYLHLAQEENGTIPEPISPEYLWGVALDELSRRQPDIRLINLETSITRSDDYWRKKSIHYRMHPANIDCLTVAEIDGCTVANNHLLDWGYAGLDETLSTLNAAGIAHAGAGSTQTDAAAPVTLTGDNATVTVIAAGASSSGIPPDWAADENTSGIHLLSGNVDTDVRQIDAQIQAADYSETPVIASLHWGSNWNYDIPAYQRSLAHRLIDDTDVDLIHGHSSHHVKGMEIYRDHLILYGCGDFITDYEGISGHEAYRGDLGLMYFPKLDSCSGKLRGMVMIPVTMRRFQLRYPEESDVVWLLERLRRECQPLGLHISRSDDYCFTVHPASQNTG